MLPLFDHIFSSISAIRRLVSCLTRKNLLGRHLLKLTPAVLLSVPLMLMTAVPAFAEKGFTVGNVLLVSDIAPGETIRHKMTVVAGNVTEAADVKVTISSVDQSPEGTYIMRADNDRYSAVPFVNVDKYFFTLANGEVQEIIATVQVPPTVGDGGRYAVIHIESIAGGQGNVGIGSAVNVPVNLTIAGSRIIHHGEITGISVSEIMGSNPIDILIDFKNTGNHHFKVHGELIVSDAAGNTLDTIYVASAGNPIIPLMTRQLKGTYIPEDDLPVGIYSIKAAVTLEDGTVLDEMTSTFEVKNTYAPPPPPASITISPFASATLKTDDENIVVDFPSGAVVSEANVGLRYYYQDQLPVPPTGFGLAATAFRFEGINGLLEKQATVAVKYSPDDLQMADYEVSRLVLGRWDEVKGSWSVFRTTLDNESSTLTAATDRPGIFAVMVKESRRGGIPWPYIIVSSGIVVACTGVGFVQYRKKQRI